jgi:WD40 repeat protein
MSIQQCLLKYLNKDVITIIFKYNNRQNKNIQIIVSDHNNCMKINCFFVSNNKVQIVTVNYTNNDIIINNNSSQNMYACSLLNNKYTITQIISNTNICYALKILNNMIIRATYDEIQIYKLINSVYTRIDNLNIKSNAITVLNDNIIVNCYNEIHIYNLVNNNFILVDRLIGHSHLVKCIETCSVTNNIISGSVDHKIKIWKLNNLTKKYVHIQTLKDANYSIIQMRTCCDVLISTSIIDSIINIYLFKLDKYILVQQIKTGKNDMSCISLDKYTMSIFVGSKYNNTLEEYAKEDNFKEKLYKTHKTIHLYGHTKEVTSIEILPNCIVSCSLDDTVRIWQ